MAGGLERLAWDSLAGDDVGHTIVPIGPVRSPLALKGLGLDFFADGENLYAGCARTLNRADPDRPLPVNTRVNARPSAYVLWSPSVISVTLRHAHVAGLAAAPGLLWLSARLRKGWRSSRRRRAGLCTGCGYDLRATPGRCPERGQIGERSKA